MSKIYPCVYCTDDGYCKKYSDEEVTSWCVQGHCKDEKPSNADRIRSMDDDELTELLYAWHLSSFSKQKEWIHNWLKKKVQI